MNYAFHLSIYFAVYAIAALSLNLVVGYCGLLTLAHASYFALGSYAYALGSLKLGWGFLPSVALGIALAAGASLAVSLPARRFRGDFFVLITLAVQVLLFSLYYNWFSPSAEPGTLRNLTNGPFGLAGIPHPRLPGGQAESLGSMAALSLGLAALCALGTRVLLRSPWARLLKAMRDEELAAQSLGKDTNLAKRQAFMIACSMVALAGALFAAYVGYIDPSTAALDHSVLLLSMVIIGGAGNFRGPLTGAALLLAVPEALRFLSLPDALAANVRLLLFGMLLVLVVQFRPRGLAGEYRVE